MKLEGALTEVRRVTRASYPWTGDDFTCAQPEHDPATIDHAIAAILNAAASGDMIPLADHKPVAWKYRWKIDGEYVGWRYSDASNAHPLLDGFEEVPLYEAPPDHRLAVALAYQRACDPVEANFPGTLYASNRTKTIDAILALADTDALAEVQALKVERDVWAKRWKELLAAGYEIKASAEAAEAEVARLREALTGLMCHEPDHPDNLWSEARAALQPKAAP